jgi:hypothetical protein
MEKHLGPLEIDCDAPPYCVVRATRQVGIVDPEDCRWARLSRHLFDWANRRGRRRAAGSRPVRCVCGGPLPGLERVTFTFDTGASVSCLVGQCPVCRSVFWDEA